MTEQHPTSPRGTPPAPSWGRRLAASAAALMLLAGFGVAQAQVTFAPADRNFQNIAVGSQSDLLPMIVTNDSGDPIEITAAALVTGSPSFLALPSPTSGTCGPFPRTLIDGATCDVRVRFVPQATGPASDTLRVTYNQGAGDLTLDTPLTGNGVQFGLVLTPNPRAFADTSVGATQVETITVTNQTSINVFFDNVTFAPAGEFVVVAGGTCTAAQNLVPSGSCTLNIQFQPSTAGNKSVEITLSQGGDVDTPGALRGRGTLTGTAPAFPPSPPTLTTLTPGNNAFTVNWTNGASNGSAVTGVTVTAAPGGATCTGAATSCTISGLTNGVNYTFTAVTNSSDLGPSGTSNNLQGVAAFTAPPTFEQAGLLLNASQPSRLLPRACGPDEATKNYVPVVVRLANAGNYFFETRVGNFDTLLLLRDASDNRVGCNDDGGAGTLSRIVYNNPTPGALYTVELTNFGSTPRTGTATLCFGELGSEGGCGFVAPSDTQSVINSTTASQLAGTRARTNEPFTVNYSLFSNVVNTKVQDGMRISARNGLGVEVGFCIGDIGDVETITGGDKPDLAKAQPKGTPFNDEATGSCQLSGLKPSDEVASLVAVFNAQPGYLASESAGFGFTVARSNTTSTLSSNSPSAFGQDIVLSATFNATAPGANPVTGTARFVRQPGNVTIVEVPIVPGVGGDPSTATTTITEDPIVSLSPITYNVVILDNVDFIGSNNNTVHTVNRASTLLTINSITPAVGPDIEVNETVTVTASVAAVLPGEGTPNGTIQVRGTGGDAAATTGCDISLSGGTGTCNLSFSTKGDATLVFSYVESANFAASSNSQAVTVLGLPVVMTLTPPPAAPFFGNSYDVIYELSGGAGNFEGAVSLTSTGPTNATATCASTSAPANNTGVCTFAGGQGVGAYTLDGAYAGDSQDLPATATANLSIQQATTELSVATDPNSSAAGETVSIDVQLLLTAGTGALDGTIEITANGLTDGVGPSTGCTFAVTAQASPFTASCERAFTLFGNGQVVSAVFTPNSGNFASDSDTTLHNVTSASTQTTITGFSPMDPQVGDAVTVNFDVNGGEGSFEGAINVSVNGTAVTCNPIVSFDTTTGVGSCRVPALFQTAADYSFVVAFVGDVGGNDASSTSEPSEVTVDPRSTQLTLTAAPANEQQAGQNVVFTLATAAITDAFVDGFDAGNVASGTAYVCLASSPECDSVSALCTATLSGAGTDGAATGTCPSSFATVGSYSFVARYVGNTNFAGSNSLALPYTVDPRDTTIAITGISKFSTGNAAATSALVGEQVTVSFNVDGGLGEYEGSVTVNADGPGPLAAICTGGSFNIETGVGSCTFSVGGGNGLEQVGTWSFSADFIPAPASNDAASSTVVSASINILQASTSLVLSSDPEPSVFGRAFTLTATVTAVAPAEGFPTGDVNFFDGESNAIGVVTLAPTATAGVSTASITGLTRNVAPAPGWRFVAATITNPNFAGANDFGYDHEVIRDGQTIQITAPASVDFDPGGSFNVSAVAFADFTEAASGQPVQISAGPAGVCAGTGTSTAGSNVSISIVGGGTCTINAEVLESQNYNGATNSTSTSIDPIDQTISFAALPNRPAAAGTFELVATAPAGAVSFASTTTDFCTVSGTTVSYVAAGVCSITASQAGNASYNAAPDVAQAFAYVAITVGPESLDGGTRNAAYSAQFTASGTGAALPFTFAVTAGALPDGLVLAANGALTGTPLDAGSYSFTITATDNSDVPNLGTPYSGSRAYTLDIAKNPQVITGFAVAPTSLVFNGPAGTLSATGGDSGQPVVFSSLTPTICSVAADQVTPLLAGTCEVAANQLGNDDYEPADQVELEITVAQAEQAELFAAATPDTVAYLQTSALSVTGGTTNGDVTYVVTAGESSCEISGSTLTAIAAGGSCTVTATMAGDDNYLPVSDTVVVTTIKAEQVGFAVDADPMTIQFNATSALSTTGGNGGGAVSYAITTDTPTFGANVCSLSGSTITAIGIGTCEVTATRAGDANYELATDSVVITAIKADQTITFGANPGPLTIGGSTGSVVATATSGLTITYGVAAGSMTVCGVNSSNGGITMLTAGTCVLTADQAGDDFYNAASQATQSVTIEQAQPAIALVGSGSPTSPGDAVTFTATVSAGFNPTGSVTFRNDGVDIAGCIGVALDIDLQAACSTTALPQGSNPVTAIYNGDINNLTATSNTVTQVVLTGTTITLSPSNLIEARFGQAVSVGYTVSGGVAPNEGNVTVTATRPGSTVTCTATASAGTCTLTGLVTTGPVLLDGYTVSAAYAGDANDGASTTAASQTLNVLRSNTNTLLTIAPVTSSPFGQGFTLTATVTAVAPGGGIPPGTIVFLRDGESIGEVALDGAGVAVFNVPAGLAVGNYVFRAEYAQTTNYLQSFENRNYAVTAKVTTTTITGSSVNPSAFGAAVSFNYSVATSPADTTPTGTVTLTASTGETCSASVAAGTCPITFNTAGARTLTAVYSGDSVHATSTSAAFPHSVDKGNQAELIAIATPDVILFGGTSTLSTTGGTGTGAVSFAVTAGGSFCEISGSTLSGTGVGTCTVTATKAGDDNYEPTSATVDVTVNRAPQAALVVTATPNPIVYLGTSALATTGGTGAGAVSYAVTGGTGSCAILGSTLTGNEVGTCEVTATKSGGDNYLDQTGSVTVTVNKAPQTITFGANPGPLTFDGTSGSVSATASSGLAVSYSTASAACSVDAASGAITIIAAGDCVVAANQAGDDNYEAAPEATQTVVINNAAQTITFGANPGPFTFGGASGSVSATASSGLAVSYSTASATVCSVDAVSGAITIIGAGNCVVAANQAGDDNYEAAPEITQTVVINKATQTITFGANPGPLTFGGTSGSVSATASSELAVSYSTASTVCSVDAVSGAITMIGAGNCVVAANQAGNDNYEAAPEVTQTVVINPGNQAPLVVIATPNPVVALQTSTLSTTGGSGNGEVTYAVTAGEAFCSVTGNTLNALAAGTCTVTATKAATNNFLVQTGTVTVTVLPATVDLSIVKTGRYTIGGIVWELLVSNTGPGPASGASVIDALPSEVVNATATWSCASNSGGGTCVTASGTGDVDVDVNLPANSSVVITITATLIGTPDTVVNTAQVIAPDGVTDTNPANNTSTLNLPVALFSNGFEGDPQLVGELKSLGGTVALDAALLEGLLEGHKAVNAARYWAGEQQLQLQVREVRGLVEVRLLQASAKQGLTSTRWIELWPGDVVRIDYAKSGGDLDSQLAVGPAQ